MPELPEVEHARRLVDSVARGRRIERLVCAEDPIVFEGVSARAVVGRLKGRRVVSTGRHGKYFWLELDRRPWPVLHLGMTGTVRVLDDQPLELASSPKTPDRSWPPRFTKLHFVFEGGAELAFTNARRLGRVRFVEAPRSEPPLVGLGPDAYLELPELPEFRARIGRRKGLIKGLLLDQSFLAGTGNWIADEILYQARIDPRRRSDALSPAEVQRIHAKIKHILAIAVAADARKDRFPKTWLFHRRWGKAKDAKTTRGDKIVHIVVAGRTTAFVPTVQR